MHFANIGLTVFTFIIICSSKYKLSLKLYRIVYIVLALSLAIYAYNAQPVGDLYSHFFYMNRIEQYNVTFFELLKNGVASDSSYRLYIIFNFICYLAVKIHNYHIVPCVLVFIDYMIIGYITVDWCSKYESSKRNLLFATVLSTMFLPYMHAMSGMRNANAACLVGLAVYLYLEKQKNLIYSLLLILIAFLMHPAAIIALPFLLLAHKKLDFKILAVVFAGLLLLSQIANFFVQSNNSYLQLLGRLYLMYSSEGQFRSMRRYLYADIVFCIILMILLFFKRRDISNTPLKNFIILIIIFALGNIGNYDLVIRPLYFFSPLSLPVADMVLNKNLKFTVKQNKYILWGVKLLLYGIGIYVFWESMRITLLYFK